MRFNTIGWAALLATFVTLGLYAGQVRAQSEFIELRFYPMQSGQRARFMEYFEEHYLGSQEVLGMHIWGQFSDLDRPDSFVWIRGFSSMDQRKSALTTFYQSPCWQETRPALFSMFGAGGLRARLLEPVSEALALEGPRLRPSLLSGDSPERPVGVIVVEHYPVGSAESESALDFVQSTRVSMLEEAGATTLGVYKSSDEANNHPRLPILQGEGENVVVWIGSFADRASYDALPKRSSAAEAPSEVYVLKAGRRSRLYHQIPGGE